MGTVAVAKKPKKVLAPQAMALHGASGSTHFVGIGNLRVMITRDHGSWFAQGLEIDYAAQGSSLEDVKKRFEEGLAATIEEHLKIYASIDKLLRPAPKEVWVELANAAAEMKRYSQVSVHTLRSLPFERIEYFEPRAA